MENIFAAYERKKRMKTSVSRVVIVGAGAVGSTTAYNLLVRGVATELILIDLNEKKVQGEVLDMRHSIEFQKRNVRVRAGSYEDCKDADIVVLTAAAPMNGETDRLKMQEESEKILTGIVPQVMMNGFDGIFIVVSNPVDIMTYLVWKLSGLPYSQVIGTGTVLETARLKNLIGQILDMDPRSVEACVMGEHGDSMMVPWSHVRAGGKEFCDILSDSRERFQEVDLDELVEQTRIAGIQVLDRKGNTQYGIASAVAHIVTAILNNENKLIPVSTYLNGEYGVSDVYCGVPAILNMHGVKEVGNLHLSEEEREKFIRSTEKIKSCIGKLKIAKDA